MPSGMVIGSDDRENFQAVYQGTCQKLAFTGTTAQSAALNTATSVVRLVATQNCHVKIGANPTAVADGTCMYLVANVPEYVGVSGGDKIAAIQDSSGGNLFIMEGASGAI